MPPTQPLTLRRLRLLPDDRLSAVVVASGRIAWVGPDETAPDTGPTYDAAGGFLTASFVDAHVHATATGLALTGLDLAGARSATDVLDAVAAAAAGLDRVLLGHGWDESGWPDSALPTRSQLERAAGPDTPVYLSRADLHSALAGGSLLDGVDHEDGRVRLGEHHVVRARALAAVTPAQARGRPAGHQGRGGTARHRVPARDERP